MFALKEYPDDNPNSLETLGLIQIHDIIITDRKVTVPMYVQGATDIGW
jgi:hypothetical protein